MDAQGVIVPLLAQFAGWFTKPGYEPFKRIMMSRMALLGLPHCVTALRRLRGIHKRQDWTTGYQFLSKGRFCCKKPSQCLLELLSERPGIGAELILAIDDRLLKKVGKGFFGLGSYPDATDKNPGAYKRKVSGHCWVVLAL